MTTNINRTYLANNCDSVCDQLAAGEEFNVHFGATRKRKAADMSVKPYKRGDIIDVWMSVADLKQAGFTAYFSRFKNIGIKRGTTNIATVTLLENDNV